MARTPAQTQSLIKKANAADNKSEGMRDLLDAGMTVAEIKEATGSPYGFVYGVARRWAAATGNAIPVAEREAKPARSTAKAAKPAAKAATTKAPSRTAKAAPKAKTTARRAAAKA